MEPICLNSLVQDVRRRVQGDNWMPGNKAMDGVDELGSTCRHAVLVSHGDGKMRGDAWTLAGCLRFVCFLLTSFPTTAFGDSCGFGEAKSIALGWDTRLGEVSQRAP